MSSKPDFELPSEETTFAEGDTVYIIDKNKRDLWKGTVKKVLKSGYTIHFDDDDEDEKVKKQRVIAVTEKNTSIFEEQVKLREEIEKEEKEKEAQKDEKDEEKPKKAKKPRKVKKPVLCPQEIVRNAWGNGIREVDPFRKFLTKSMDKIVKEFERYHKMMNIADYPLFQLAGGVSEDAKQTFWKQAQAQWRGLFGDAEAVDPKVFVRKAAEAMRLPKQAESNARETLAWFFDIGTLDTVDFAQFCAFLAMFGPSETAIRKIGHFLKCPTELKDAVMYVDLEEVRDPDIDIEEIQANEFTIMIGDTEKAVYNRPDVNTDGKYLIDSDGKEYSSWMEYFESNPVEPKGEVEVEPMEEAQEPEKPKKQRKPKKMAKLSQDQVMSQQRVKESEDEDEKDE